MSNAPQDKSMWVEQYLNGELNAAERAAFEEALQSDEELAETLALRQDIQSLLTDEHPALTAQMRSLNAQYFGKRPLRPSPHWRRWSIIGGVLLVVGALIWWQSSRSPDWVPADLPAPAIDSVAPTPPSSEDVPDTSMTPVSPAPTSPLPTETRPAPIAAGFVPVPAMEALLREELRSAPTQLSLALTFPPYDYAYPSTTPIVFKLQGTTTLPSIYVELYNNDPDRIDLQQPVTKFTLQLPPTDEAMQYRIDFERAIELPQGLYYLVIKPSESSLDLLDLTRFRVAAQE